MSLPDRAAIRSTLLILLLANPGLLLAQGDVRGPGDPTWERKLGPFLRRIVNGTTRVQGPFRAPVPASSPPLLRSLPDWLQIDARRDRPSILVKARFDDATLEGSRLTAPVRGALEDLGIEVRGRVRNFASLKVPVDAIDRLAALPFVSWLKAAHAYWLQNDVSTGSSHVASDAASVQFGTEGGGVIVAVVDTGIDWSNPDFRHDDGTSRILGIWDQTLTDPAHGPPSGFAFGAFYSKAVIDAALQPGGSLLTGDGHGHGTHVTGTAAGNGRHTGNDIPAGTFAGVAPAADILVVRVFDDVGAFCLDCDLTAAVQFIRDFAAAEGKPWVGNMSLGSDIGAHDGTDPDELSIDAAVGPGRPGAQLAIAAGNSGGAAMHWTSTLVQGVTSQNALIVPSYTPGPEVEDDVIWIDLWYEGAVDLSVQLTAPNGVSVTAATGEDSGIVCTTAGAVWIDATNAPDPVNADNEVFMLILDDPGCDPVIPPDDGTWTIRITPSIMPPGQGTFHIWNQATIGFGYIPMAAFNLESSVSIPGTARHALTAGSYVAKDRWVNSTGGNTCCPRSASVGALSSFSGIGPTRDGRLKPDLTAPGEWVGSTLAGFVGDTRGTLFTERDGVHGDIHGTSMATPHVTGAAALVLSINPDLQGPEVKAALLAGAGADGFTGILPNNSYGSGKLRADGGGRQAAAIVTDLDISADGTAGGTSSPFANGYNVYRVNIPGLSASNYGTCFLQDLPSASFDDPAVPLANEILAYLIVGVVDDIEGILGVNGDGQVRPNNFPCP
ncbi:MAG: S8 family serine peptidase [Acidobacteria bacterium]|nr:S8 family serine peptidase [Acidobacteriota bacterium]